MKWLSRWMIRIGLRLSGFNPARTVMWSDPDWSAAGWADWMVKANAAGPYTPQAMIIPYELADAYQRAVTATPTPKPEQPTP